MKRLVLVLSYLGALGCAGGPILIDGRSDAGLGDAGLADSAALDAAASDGGCAPTPPAGWSPIDTGGPDGETVSACLARVGSRTDSRVPEDQGYDLTTFGGPGDEQDVACGGPRADGSWYYAAGSQRFACGQRVRLVSADRTRCVIVEVADVGPNACVEEAGARPIWDVSPLAAQHLVGSSSVGWSDHEAVLGAPVGSDNALGPCDAQLDAPDLAGFVGGPCASAADCTFDGAVCLTEAQGFPGGLCTRPCGGSCPDRAGAFAYTGCADVGPMVGCAARCDHTLFPETGCREGYGCETQPHPTDPSLPSRRVCVPLSCG